MSPVYGPLASTTPETFEAEKKAEAINPGNVYGPMVVEPVGANPPLVVTETSSSLVSTPIGADYTIGELEAAIEADPSLANQLALAELVRAQGARKGALRYFLESAKLTDETAILVAAQLAEMGG